MAKKNEMAIQRARFSSTLKAAKEEGAQAVQAAKAKLRATQEVAKTELVLGPAAQGMGAVVGAQIRRKFAVNEEGEDTLYKVRMANYGAAIAGVVVAVNAKGRTGRMVGLGMTGAGVYQLGRDAEDWDLIPFEEDK